MQPDLGITKTSPVIDGMGYVVKARLAETINTNKKQSVNLFLIRIHYSCHQCQRSFQSSKKINHFSFLPSSGANAEQKVLFFFLV